MLGDNLFTRQDFYVFLYAVFFIQFSWTKTTQNKQRVISPFFVWFQNYNLPDGPCSSLHYLQYVNLSLPQWQKFIFSQILLTAPIRHRRNDLSGFYLKQSVSQKLR